MTHEAERNIRVPNDKGSTTNCITDCKFFRRPDIDGGRTWANLEKI